MYNKLNATNNNYDLPDRAVCFNPMGDINAYETLCLYCAENNFDINSITDSEFQATGDVIQNFINVSRDERKDFMAFWLDN